MASLTLVKILGNLKFLSHGLKLGEDKDPDGDDKKIFGSGDSISAAGNQTDSNLLTAIPTLIPPWFMPAEIPNKLHQKACDDIGKNMKDFHDDMLDAVSY